MKTKNWFRPKRFFGWFAAYYPTSVEGWIITFAIAFVFVKTFRIVDAASHSASDTLLGFAPYAIFLMLVFDISTRLFGEYPSWWRKWKKWKKG